MPRRPAERPVVPAADGAQTVEAGQHVDKSRWAVTSLGNQYRKALQRVEAEEHREVAVAHKASASGMGRHNTTGPVDISAVEPHKPVGHLDVHRQRVTAGNRAAAAVASRNKLLVSAPWPAC